VNALVCSIPTLAISSIYCIWHANRLRQQRRERILRERVTYLLWVLANSLECDEPVHASTLEQQQQAEGPPSQDPE
jgi:hypothetical protein